MSVSPLLSRNDKDIDSDKLTITEVGGKSANVGKATDGSDGGSFTIDSKGGWTFNPDGDFDKLADGDTATTSVEYTVSDSKGETDTATVTVTVTGTNDGLTANDDSGTTTQNAPLTVADSATGPNADLLLNDVDIDSDDLTITEVGGKSANVGTAVDGSGGGSFTIRVDGSWDFNPGTAFDDLAAGVTRTTSVVYTVSDRNDGTGLTDTATLTVTVTGTNDGLTAKDDAGTTTENKILTVADDATGTTSGTTTINADLLRNDKDIDSDDLTITEVGGKSANVGTAVDGSGGGSFTIRADGSWDFNPGTAFDDLVAGVTKTTSVVYTVSDRNDGTGLTDTATLTVTVTGTNDGLTANDDSGTTTQNTELTVADSATGLLQNDIDIDGDTLSISAVGGDAANVGKAINVADGGKFTIRADGSWSFDPDGDFDDLADGKTRTTSVEYTASDSKGETDTATVTVTVTGTNDVPVLTKGTGTVTEDGNLVASGTVSSSGGDDGESGFTAETVTSSVGELKIDAAGAWTYTADNKAIQGLKADATLIDTLTVTSADGATTTTVTITINGADDEPVAVDDAGATTENTVLTVKDGDTATTMIVTDPITGDTSTVIGYPDLLLNDSDPEGDSLTITAVKGYTLEADGSYKAQEEAVPVTKDGTAATPSTTSPQTSTLGSSGGTFTLYADGSYTFDPGTDFDNLADGKTRTTSVTYTVSDGSLTHTATLTVTVTGTNDAPVAVDDASRTAENDKLTVADGATGTVITNADMVTTTTINTDLLINDIDRDGDTLTITQITGFNQGQPTVVAPGAAVGGSALGQFTINADGSWEFNPGTDFDDLKADETRDTLVAYTVSDGKGGTDTKSLTVRVTGEDDVPTITGTTTGTVTEEAADASGNLVASGTVKASGGDAGEDKFKAETLTGAYGSLEIKDDGAWTWTAANSDAKIQGLKATDSPTDTFTVTNADGVTTTTVSITINGADDAPVANDDTGATTENTPLTVADGDTGRAGGGAQRVNADLLENDVDLDGDTLTITEVAGDTDNVGSATAGTDENGNAGGSFTIHDDGSWSFDPGSDFNDLADGATRTTSVVYTISDNTVTDTATLTVTVTGVGDAPTANDDTGSTAENTPLTVADGATGTTVDGGAQRTNADLLLNDTDPDGDTLTITEVAGDTANVGSATTGDNGGQFTIRADGSWRFDPGADFDGLAAGATATTSVQYTASDGTLTDTATLTVTVTGEADAPSLTAATATVTEDTALVSGNLVASGTVGSSGGDAGESRFRAETVTGDYGSLRIDASGDWRYMAANSQSAIQGLSATDSLSDAFTVTSADRVTTTTVTITINGVNDTPSLTAATATVTEDTALVSGNLVASGTVGSSGGDAGETRFRAETLSGDYGSLRIDASGDWRYTAANSQSAIQGLDADDSLTDAFTVTSADRVTTTTVSITINGADDVVLPPPPAVNEAPTAADDSGSTVADTVLTVAGEAIGSAGVNAGLLLNDVDIDGDRLSITTVAGFSRDAEGNYQPLQEAVAAGTPTLGSNGGQFTIEADGSWRFDPDADFDDLAPDATRTTALTYTVSDGSGGIDTATLTVTIRGAADVPPTLVTDTVVTGTGSAPTPEPALSTIDPAAPPSEAGLRRPDADEDEDDEADGDNFLVPDQFWGTADGSVRLGISLDEQRIPAQGSSTIVLPSNTFVHTDPVALIRVEASLVDGSDLPEYIIFDPDTLSFEVDGEAAAAAGTDEITILLTGRDAAGNSAFGVFVINLRDLEEDTEDETGVGELLPAVDARPAATEADGGEPEQSGDAGSAATGAEDQTEADGNEPEQSDAKESEAGQADGREQAAAQKNFDSQLEQVSRNNFMDSIEQLLEDVKTLLL